MDRFMVRLSVGYPSAELECQLLSERVQRKAENATLTSVLSADEARWMQQQIENVTIDSSLQRYIVDIVQMTRARPQISVGSSPRGSLALMAMARARAAIKGRSYVIPDDIKYFAVSVLAHRIVLIPELWLTSNESLLQIQKILDQVSVPMLDVEVA